MRSKAIQSALSGQTISTLPPTQPPSCPTLTPVTFVPMSHLNPPPTCVLVLSQASWPPVSPSHAVHMDKLASEGGERWRV